MIFKEEYQKEMNRVSPTNAQCERIRNGVLGQISETEKRKKPLFPKIAAISSASVCAAAVLVVAAVGALKVVSKSSIDGITANEGFFNNVAGNAAPEMTNSPQSVLSQYTDCVDKSYGITPDSGGETMYPSDSLGAGNDPGNNIGVGEPSAPSSAALAGVELDFSEDFSMCEVTTNNKRTNYRASNRAFESQILGEPIPAGSELGITLFVQFYEDYLVIFTENEKIFGVYEAV